MTKLQAVVFDIGNVLIEWQPERFYDRVIGPERRTEMFAAVDLHAMNDKVDRGENFRDTVMAMAQATPDWRPEIEMWHDRWIEMASPVIDRSVRLLRALRRGGTPVFALSNFGVQSFDLALRHYPFLEEFDQQFISGRMRMAKPDAEIYAAVESGTGFDPAALLFADDRADNIAAASARGWATHLFTGPGGLAERLVGEGLLTADQAE